MNNKYEYKKIFADLESEEKWLTEMSEKGFALKGIRGAFLGYKYSFEPMRKKYVYRVDYNYEGPVLEEITSPYVMFVTGTYGAEYVLCSHGRVYFRKAADEGNFPPIYTTSESRLAAEKKKLAQYIAFALCLFLSTLWGTDGFGIFIRLSFASPHFWLQAVAALIFSICFVYCIKSAYIHYKKIKEIKNKI